MQNYYETLGVSRYALNDEIKQATHKQIQLIKAAYATLSDNDKRQAYDANPSEPDYYVVLDADPSVTSTRLKLTAQEKLDELKEIYQILSDPTKRDAYDESLGTEADSEPVTLNLSQPEATPNEETNPYAAPDTEVKDVSIDTGIPLASRSSRFVAYILDGFIYLMPFIIVVAAIFVLEGGLSLEIFESEEAMEDFVMNLATSPFVYAYLGVMLLTPLLILIINIVLLVRNGQTIGKRLMKIRIVRKDYSRAGFWRIVLLRYIVMGLIGGIPIIGLFIQLANYLFIFGKARRCLHDYIADTIVVDAQNK